MAGLAVAAAMSYAHTPPESFGVPMTHSNISHRSNDTSASSDPGSEGVSPHPQPPQPASSASSSRLQGVRFSRSRAAHIKIRLLRFNSLPQPLRHTSETYLTMGVVRGCGPRHTHIHAGGFRRCLWPTCCTVGCCSYSSFRSSGGGACGSYTRSGPECAWPAPSSSQFSSCSIGFLLSSRLPTLPLLPGVGRRTRSTSLLTTIMMVTMTASYCNAESISMTRTPRFAKDNHNHHSSESPLTRCSSSVSDLNIIYIYIVLAPVLCTNITKVVTHMWTYQL